MSVADFGVEVGKVTALVGDGHTFAYGFDDRDDEALVFGVWFSVVAGDLVLMRTHHDQLIGLFGSRLRAVNGVPVAHLLVALSQLVGADNEVALATGLAARLRSPRWVGLLTSTSTTPTRRHPGLHQSRWWRCRGVGHRDRTDRYRPSDTVVEC